MKALLDEGVPKTVAFLLRELGLEAAGFRMRGKDFAMATFSDGLGRTATTA